MKKIYEVLGGPHDGEFLECDHRAQALAMPREGDRQHMRLAWYTRCKNGHLHYQGETKKGEET